MATKKSAPLDPKVADKLLELLSTDNEFRRLFKKDPQAALAQAGHPEAKAALRTGAAPTATSAASCMQVQRIAPKATIAKARSELKLMLTSGLGQIPPQLDATYGEGARPRRK